MYRIIFLFLLLHGFTANAQWEPELTLPKNVRSVSVWTSNTNAIDDKRRLSERTDYYPNGQLKSNLKLWERGDTALYMQYELGPDSLVCRSFCCGTNQNIFTDKFKFTKSGKIVEESGKEGVYTNKYDKLDRLTMRTSVSTGGFMGMQYTYSYAENGWIKNRDGFHLFKGKFQPAISYEYVVDPELYRDEVGDTLIKLKEYQVTTAGGGLSWIGKEPDNNWEPVYTTPEKTAPVLTADYLFNNSGILILKTLYSFGKPFMYESYQYEFY